MLNTTGTNQFTQAIRLEISDQNPSGFCFLVQINAFVFKSRWDYQI